MSNAAEITLEYLHECFEPDYEKGILYWKERPRHHFKTERGWNTFNSQRANNLALHISGNGYCHVGIKLLNRPKTKILIHRILYQMYHSKILSSDVSIDHIDGNPSNNSISNLRECSTSQNQCNSKKRKDNTTGVKGVSLCSHGSQKYYAQIWFNNKKHGKRFYNLEEAETWVKEKRAELHGGFANDGE